MQNPKTRYNPITNKPIVESVKDSQQNLSQNNDPSRNNKNTMLPSNKSNSNFNTNNKNTASKQTQNQNQNFQNNFSKNNKNSLCSLHNLEIGGCCESFECISKHQVCCAKCASDPNLCIRNSKHEFISIEEFIANFTERELYSLKNDNQFSKSFTLSRNLLENEVNIKNEFLEKSRNIQDEINDYYCNLIDYAKSLLDDFNDKFEKFVNSKFSTLMSSYENLNRLTTYEELAKFDKNKLLENSTKMSYEELTDLITNMKKTVYNFKKKNCDSDLDNIKYLMDLNVKNENVFMIKKKFEEIKNELDTKHLSFCNNLEKNIFFTNKLTNNASKSNNTTTNRNNNRENFNSNSNDYFEETESTGLNNLALFKEFTVDYSINSNFIDKRFLIFEHSNGNSYLVFPTSQNAIKLIGFNSLLKDESFNALSDHSNENLNFDSQNKQSAALKGQVGEIKQHKATLITSKDFERAEPIDKHLLYKLCSHGGKITHLKYYRLSTGNEQVKDLLITASEDKCIKIWDISDLNKYLNDVNKQYRNLCVKTLMAHDNNKISSFVNFFDPLKNKAFIVSSGFGDRIKVWDLTMGVIAREVADSAKAPNFDNELIVFHENFSSKNFMITSGHNNSVRIWDFDLGKVLMTFQHKEKILDLIYFNNDKDKVNLKNKNYKYNNNFCYYLPKIFAADDSGKCVSLLFEKDEKGELAFNFKTEGVNTGSAVRNGGVKWNEGKVFLYCKTGQICEYEIDILSDYFNNFSANTNKEFNSLSYINGLSHNNNINNNVNLNKFANSISLGVSAISYCEKFSDLVFGDLLIVHSHDQKIKILKLK